MMEGRRGVQAKGERRLRLERPERQPVPGFAPARIPAEAPGEAPLPPGSGHGPLVRGGGQSSGRAALIAGPPRDSVNTPRPTFLQFLLSSRRIGPASNALRAVSLMDRSTAAQDLDDDLL